jgi:hypothetical protein
MLDNKESDDECEMGTMEAGAGVGGSECEKMYKQCVHQIERKPGTSLARGSSTV